MSSLHRVTCYRRHSRPVWRLHNSRLCTRQPWYIIKKKIENTQNASNLTKTNKQTNAKTNKQIRNTLAAFSGASSMSISFTSSVKTSYGYNVPFRLLFVCIFQLVNDNIYETRRRIRKDIRANEPSSPISFRNPNCLLFSKEKNRIKIIRERERESKTTEKHYYQVSKTCNDRQSSSLQGLLANHRSNHFARKIVKKKKIRLLF